MAANDLGGLGPEEGTPVVYYWNPLWHLLRVAPWLILLLALARKPNRNRKALAAPAVALAIAVVAGVAVMLLASAVVDVEGMGQALALVALGLAAVWLLADAFAGMPRVLAFFAAGVVLALIGVVGAPCVMGLSPGMILCGFLYFVLAGAVMLGLFFGGVFCRKRYSAARFLGWFSLCVVGVPFVVVLAFGCLGALMMAVHVGAAQAFGMVGTAAGAGLVVGASLWVAAAPFIGLALRVPFYRDRFHGVYAFHGIGGGPGAPPVSPDGEEAGS